MRVFVPTVALAALCVTPGAYAQSPYDRAAAPTVNQRLTTPTNQADGYMGLSLGQLIMALGLTLKGVSYGPEDIRLIRPRQTAEAPPPPHEAAAARPAVMAPGNAPPSP